MTAPGEIVLDDASRAFSVRGDRGRTLKELLLRRDAGEGPPPVQALDGVSMHVSPGETVGIVGRNGAGKSSTLRVLAGIVPLDSGTVDCGGRIVSLLELGAGFGREFTGRENIELSGALHGVGRAEVQRLIAPIIAFSELGHFIDVPVKTYSSGMLVRLGFAIAAHLDADVMLIDEVLAVGDEAFQRKCLRRISERIAAGATLVLVTHDAGAIERVCERVVVLDAGRVIFDGGVADGLLFYHRLMGTEHGAGESVRPAGDRPVALTDVELQGDDGNRRQFFATGEPLRMVVALRAAAPVDSPRLAVEFRDVSGRPVFRTGTPVELVDGAAQMAFEISRLPLLGGDYDIALGAGGGDEEPEPDRVVHFSVAETQGASGVVDLRGEWRAPAAAEART